MIRKELLGVQLSQEKDLLGEGGGTVKWDHLLIVLFLLLNSFLKNKEEYLQLLEV